MLKKTLLLVTLMVPCMFASAHEYDAGQLHIEHPWSREMPPVAPAAAAYFVVENHGKEADALISVSSPQAGLAQMHENLMEDGVMKMQEVKRVDIPAGGEVRFEPKGYHVMLMQLKGQMKDGERFPLTLNFEKSGAVTVEVAVQKTAPAEHSEHQH
ncbi:Copper metallochaperone, bacterial analog of Cox17 protein [Pseudomonas marincola]|uniref:Copper chaperone PCu(A)C n=1 Tax=Pseudomonas marincola TaxID=437900 RepID=A0A653DYX8_9PSED|nr:copper chaperone PCu(A)C [Pseudomonas marincola]CAE6937795.1 Copper metallochaperone, bacterial analog of Cox17 protein [Pseudomonas marincola]